MGVCFMFVSVAYLEQIQLIPTTYKLKVQLVVKNSDDKLIRRKKNVFTKFSSKLFS